MIVKSLVIDVNAYPWRRGYDPGSLDRHASEILSRANPGDFVQLYVGTLEPSPVPESFSWVRPDIHYNIVGPDSRVNDAWERSLEAANRATTDPIWVGDR